MASSFRAWSVLAMLLGVFVLSIGCDDKPAPQPVTYPTVLLASADIAKDGTFSPNAMQQIKAKSGEGAFSVKVLRTPLRDGALTQLSGIANLKSLEAVGSAFTQAALDKFKQANPGVEVIR